VILSLGNTPAVLFVLVVKLAVTTWLAAIAYSDWRTTRIPNRLSLSGLVLFGGWRIVRGAWHGLGLLALRVLAASPAWARTASSDGGAWSALRFMLLAWAVTFVLWELHMIGGGDAKTLMGLLALFPSAGFLLFLCVGVLVLGLPTVLLNLRGRKPREIPGALFRWVKEGHLLPSERQLAEEGRPYVWMFCLPGVVYLWFRW
jgi:Flp pilus assembly protein protease CpaA